MAVGHPLFLSRLNVCYPQIIVINERKEGRVGRADLGIHSWPCALSLDLQRLHWRHLQQQTHKQLCTKSASSFIFKGLNHRYSTAHEMMVNTAPTEHKRSDHNQTDAEVQPSPTKTMKSTSGDIKKITSRLTMKPFLPPSRQ